jgi:hypothetical protein
MIRKDVQNIVFGRFFIAKTQNRTKPNSGGDALKSFIVSCSPSLRALAKQSRN